MDRCVVRTGWLGCCLMAFGIVLASELGGAEPTAAKAPAATTAPAAGSAQAVLSNASNWRSFTMTRHPVVRVGSDVKPLGFHAYGGIWVLLEGAKDISPMIESAAPSSGWAAADFDDQSWARSTGPFFPTNRGHAYCKEVDDAGFLGFEGTHPTLAAVCIRGKFAVADPAAVGDMKLALAYRGGVVVYLNGEEIARANIPDDQKAKGLEALAEDYPREVFVKEDGKLISWGFGDPTKYYAQLQKRIRRLDGVTVPARLLRKGVNVLAVEAHRSPYHESVFGAVTRGRGYEINWCTVGVMRVELTVAGAGAQANVARPAGLSVWNQDTGKRVNPADYGDPCEPLRPIRLVGARNGVFSGELVVGSPSMIRNLKVVAGELTGAGTIPASAVEVRYALPDRDVGLPSEILSPAAPAEVPTDKVGAVMSVWVMVKVPADARPGAYKGKLTVAADGEKPVEAAVELRVVDWKLPDSRQFISHVGLVQSPESVAYRYKVPLWSPEHWKLMESSFELLGQAGTDDVFITALRRTHFGNEHGMIRWIKQPGGATGTAPAISQVNPDLSIAEKYLDLAVKHLGKPPVVCVYCWEPYTGSNYGGKVTGNKGVLYSVVDPATGQVEEAEGPKWGTPEAREFWKPVFDGLRDILKKRVLEGSLMLGVAGDSRPNKDAVEDLKAVAPEAKWVVQSHVTADNFFGQPVGYLADVWNSPVPPDPSKKRLYGWNTPFLRTTFPRYGSSTVMDIRTPSPLAQYRVGLEGMSAAGLHGFGRMGADFWEVLDPKAPYRNSYSGSLNILGRYLESNWGQLYLGNSTPYVLAAGPQGALPTARFEMIRAGAQDMEARVFLEKALLDPALRAKLGDDLAQRCQQLLDDRVRAVLIGRTSWLLFGQADERIAQLYTLAGEAAGKLAK